jgi:hypothetical protein
MVTYSGNDPRNAPDITETFASDGWLVKHTTSGIAKTTAVTDVPVGYAAAESSRGEDQALEAAGTGTLAVLPLDGLCFLRCASAVAAGSTLKFGAIIYTSQTASTNGTVDIDNSASAVTVGYYCGDETAIAAGDLIPVWC